MEDAVYLLLAGGLIACAILAYTRSVFLTLTTLTSILYTLSLAYFFYTFVCGIAFFPFMNVLATVIAIGRYRSVEIIFNLGTLIHKAYDFKNKSSSNMFMIYKIPSIVSVIIQTK